MYKLIATDLDGTLLKSGDDISPFTLDALNKAIDKGIEIIICTGRNYYEVKILLEKYNFKVGAICLNGAKIVDKDGNNLVDICLDDELIDRYYQMSIDNDMACFYHCDDKVKLTISYKKYKEYFDMYAKLTELKEKDTVFDFFKNYGSYANRIEDIKKLGVSKIEYTCVIPNIFEDLMEKVKTPSVSVTTSHELNNIEITKIEATKGEALRKYCLLNKIDCGQVLVFGDNGNDLSMFKLFKNTVAMENATAEIKGASRYSTLSNQEDGVGTFIINNVLLND